MGNYSDPATTTILTMNAEHDRLRAENARLREELAQLAVESAATITECHHLRARIAVLDAEAARLRRADADAVMWAKRVTGGIEIMKGQLAAVTAARDEACDIAEANIFAPSPIDAYEGPLQNLVNRSYTITVDTSKPYRDKARVAELRKVDGL